MMWAMLSLVLVFFVCVAVPHQHLDALSSVQDTQSNAPEIFYRQYINMAYFKNSLGCSVGNAIYSVTQSDYHLCRPTSPNTVTPNGQIANSFTMLLSGDCQQYRAVYYHNDECSGTEAWTDPVARQLELDEWSSTCDVVNDMGDQSLTRKLTCSSEKIGSEILKKTEFFTNMVFEEGNTDCKGMPIREINFVADDCITIGYNSMKWTREGDFVYRTEYKGDRTCSITPTSPTSTTTDIVTTEIEHYIGACSNSIAGSDDRSSTHTHSEHGTFTAAPQPSLVSTIHDGGIGIAQSQYIRIHASLQLGGLTSIETFDAYAFKEAVNSIVQQPSRFTAINITAVREHKGRVQIPRLRSVYLENATNHLDVDVAFIAIDYSITVEVTPDVKAASVFAFVNYSMAQATSDIQNGTFVVAYGVAAEERGSGRGRKLAKNAVKLISPTRITQEFITLMADTLPLPSLEDARSLPLPPLEDTIWKIVVQGFFATYYSSFYNTYYSSLYWLPMLVCSIGAMTLLLMYYSRIIIAFSEGSMRSSFTMKGARIAIHNLLDSRHYTAFWQSDYTVSHGLAQRTSIQAINEYTSNNSHTKLNEVRPEDGVGMDSETTSSPITTPKLIRRLSRMSKLDCIDSSDTGRSSSSTCQGKQLLFPMEIPMEGMGMNEGMNEGMSEVRPEFDDEDMDGGSITYNSLFPITTPKRSPGLPELTLQILYTPDSQSPSPSESDVSFSQSSSRKHGLIACAIDIKDMSPTSRHPSCVHPELSPELSAIRSMSMTQGRRDGRDGTTHSIFWSDDHDSHNGLS